MGDTGRALGDAKELLQIMEEKTDDRNVRHQAKAMVI